MKIGLVRSNRVLAGAFGLLLTLVLAVGLGIPALADAPPTPPPTIQFYGTVTLDGNPAPLNTVISAQVGAVEKASCLVSNPKGVGYYGYGTHTLTWVGTPGEVIVVDFYVNGFWGGNYTLNTQAFNLPVEVDLAAISSGVQQYVLTINHTTGGNVTVPGEGNFTRVAGTVVNLEATPQDGYCFVNWTGSTGTMGNASAASTPITMSGNYTIQANFVAKYVLNVSSGTGGNVTTPSEATTSYCPGEVASLVATPDPGYAFVNWTGNTGTMGNASAASTNITMNGNYTITANFVFVGTHWLMVNTTAGGTVTQPGVGNTTQTAGAVVNLVAVEDTGCFVNWTGNVTTIGNASAASTTITMNGDYTVTANFVAKYTLTMTSTSGGTVTTPGVGSFPYCPGAVVPLVATQDADHCFSSWTGGPVGNASAASTTITMNGNYTIQANFVAKYVLNVSSGTGGTVTTPSVATTSYCPGGVVNLVATASTGYNFVNWTGGPVGNASAASTTITMNGSYTITANFVNVGTHWLMVNTTTGGTVTQPGVGNTTQTAGAVVNLVATPDATHCFVNWTGSTGTIANASAASTTITMNGDYTVTANFVAKYTLTVTSGTGGTVTTPGLGSFSYCPGIMVNLVATVNSGYAFVNWTGNGTAASPTAASTTITMNGSYAIQANFQSTGGGGGGGGGGGATPTPTPTPTHTPTPTPTPVLTPPPIPTPTPIDISGSISGNGTVTQTIVYSVLDGQAVLTVGTGTTALTATGGPVQSLSVTEECVNIPQAGGCIVGCAYDYTPNGATFSPAVTLTLKYDPGMVPSSVNASKLVMAYYNTATSKWVVVAGSVVDTVNHTVTAQVSEFTMFAVYSCAPGATPTPTVTVGPTPTPTPTPTPAAGGKKTNIGVIIGPIIAVIIIALVAYWFWMRRKKPPAPPAPTEGPKTEGPKKT
jgi:hypothetical protein